MSRRALKRVWKPVHAHADARIRIHDSADSLPHAALVRADRPTFDCPRCGWQNDRAPFCLWCLCQDEGEFKAKWQRPLRRRITSPSLVCPVPPTPPARRPFSSPAPPSSSAPPAPPISPPPTTTPTCPATADDSNFNGPPANVVDTTYMSIPPPFPVTTTLTATTTITSAAPAPCTPPSSPLLSTTNRVRYPSAASSLAPSPTAASPLPWPPTASSASTSQTQSPPLSPTSTKFSAYVSRKTAEREARMHRIAECANAAAVTLDISARPTSPLAPPPAPGAIALGHLLPIPGSLRISNIPPGGGGGTSVAGGSRTSLDLRSVRSREADSLYSPARSVASRSSAGVGLGGGGRRSRSVHRRGESSQYSLAPPLPSPAEISDEDADADEELRTPQSLRGRGRSHSDATAGRGKRAAATVGKFFRRMGGAMHIPHMPHRDRGREDAQHAREDGGERASAVAPGEGERAGAGEAGGMRDGVAAAEPGGGISAKSGVGRLLEWTSAAWGRRRRR